jgi:hypothetical protein
VGRDGARQQSKAGHQRHDGGGARGCTSGGIGGTLAVVWRWLAVVGVLAGVLLTVGTAFPLADDPTGPLWTIRFLSFIVLAVFVVSASIGMLLGAGPATPTGTPPTRA